ncbi:MAG: tRNA uridine-5-carboxymethylaminomethyl(34) synthesis enzyme MnmG, partial [Nitrospinota bacterium]
SLSDLLKRPGVHYETFPGGVPEGVSRDIKEEVEIQVKYDGYIKRQLFEIERLEKIENKKIPQGFDYSEISTLSNEIRQKLSVVRPETLGQAARISGVTPAAILVLGVCLQKK